jgi:ectoine hydroxylase-related dioxygenase (phytanoyl-CoA dioxygenase family)
VDSLVAYIKEASSTKSVDDALVKRSFWISLTIMSADNGGLWVVPISHKGILKY